MTTPSQSPVPSAAQAAIRQLVSSYDPHKHLFYQVWMGTRFFGAGWSLLLASPSLWPASVVPALLSAAFFSGVIYFTSTRIYQWLSSALASLPQWLEPLTQILGLLVTLLILLLVTYLLFFPIVSIVAAPFREMLSEQTERLLQGTLPQSERSFWQEISVAVSDTLKLVSLQLVISLLLLLLSFWLPVLAGIPILIVSIYFAAMDCIDPPLGRRGWRLGQKLQFLKQRAGLLGGFGLAANFLLALPGINLITLPVATIGGTLLILANLKENH